MSRDDNLAGQCICPECGRIAKSKRGRTGRKLPYAVCANCHTVRNISEEKRQAIINTTAEHIGEYGQFPENAQRGTASAENAAASEPENKPASIPEKSETEWRPSAEHKPENTRTESQAPSEQSRNEAEEETEQGGNGWVLAVAGVLAVGLLGVGATRLLKNTGV